MDSKHIPGKGCTCAAYDASECGCVSVDWRSRRPDLDNLEKLMLDCMTRMQFWKDDSQVYSKDTAKFWSAYPGIAVAISEDNQ